MSCRADQQMLDVSARNYLTFAVGAPFRRTAEAAHAMAKPANHQRHAAPPLCGRTMIPVWAALLAIARPASQKIQRERNRREKQQKINQRSGSKVHRVIE
jgi:hypothetical protein